MNYRTLLFSFTTLLGSNFFFSHACLESPSCTQRNVWRAVQEKARDTVVQIFCQSAKVDLLHPYQTPEQMVCAGSGFFIDSEGHIITNAHVVDQAVGIWIHIPQLGKRPMQAYLVSICPERDLALLRLSEEGRSLIRQMLGEIPFLTLGNSDLVYRSDEILALGYPLAQPSLKSTKGVISGREQDLIQVDAATNPGSSGGPSLNVKGEVIGINNSGYLASDAENVGYMIPVNILKLILDDMSENLLLRRPILGLVMSSGTDELTDYLGNPQPGGSYIVEVIEGSTIEKAGIKRGDMLYEIDGYHLDIYGEMKVDWSEEDRVSVFNYVSRLKTGQQVHMVVYRQGERNDFTLTVTQHDLPAIRTIHPGYEPLDYELFAGMVLMQLTENHIKLLISNAPGLFRYTRPEYTGTPALVVTHVFPNTELHRSRMMYPGVTIHEVNGQMVETLDDFRTAILNKTNQKNLVLRASDNASGATDNLLVVLAMNKILQDDLELSDTYRYELSELVRQVLEARSAKA